MTDSNDQNNTSQANSAGAKGGAAPGELDAGKRPYEAPRVLSAEPLEAAAATCDPPTGAFGKSVPIPCATVGS